MVSIPQENLSAEALKAERKRKRAPGSAPKEKKDRSLRATFRALLKTVDIEKLKKPWMNRKSFQLVTTEEQLVAYVDSILNDESVWQQPYYNKPERMPVVAVDTETHGLDTRVMVSFDLRYDADLGREVCTPIYELNIEIAGICLSADGIKGVYIPVFHEDGKNVPIEVVHRELQRLFDVSHLVFYNAKFDREVLRQTVGLSFRDYPFYEDIQALHFSNDPKAELDGDEFAGGGGDGLKGLSLGLLNMEQIKLDTIGKVKAEVELSAEQQQEIWLRPTWVRLKKSEKFLCSNCGTLGPKATCKACSVVAQEIRCDGCVQAPAFLRMQIVIDEQGERVSRRYECPQCSTKVTFKKTGLRVQHVPFSWVPTEIALWYAAADAICTWLLWAYRPQRMNPDDPEPDSLHEEAQKRRVVHRIDGELIDTLTWMERQRYLIDGERHARLVKWSVRANEERRRNLSELAKKHGWVENTDDDGNPFPDSVFNVDSSTIHLPKLLYDLKGFTPPRITDSGNRSCDASALEDLMKQHPHDEFLLALKDYKEYVALHPEKLTWDKRDGSARIYLKQSTVAGGRLAASGGKFDRDGGVGVNIQAIKSVGGNWWVKGDLLTPDYIEPEDVEEREEHELDPSCFIAVKKDEIVGDGSVVLEPTDERYAVSAEKQGFRLRDGKWTKKAPGILKNHIANYLGYSICLVPGCTSCAEKHGVLIPKTKIDANQIINLRALFVAPAGWTILSSDYSNIEVRAAANISGEQELIKIFLEGDGDHHALTASKIFPEFNDPNTSKARRKELRSIAKIINFALQYGGSEFTIYENLKAIIPDITMERTREMVAKYWEGVPAFERWCNDKQRIAREQMVCHTTTGRVIKFDSAMKALRITEPTHEQMDNYFHYLRIRKQFRKAEERFKQTQSAEDRAEVENYKQHMDRLWNDSDTGVRNAAEYNKFIAKIQRVSVNAPVQGLAGDFMRIALNRVRRWATSAADFLVQSVLRVHSSVHDEIDYAVKNEYLPFVVPRITRVMKLRAIHAKQQWPVPIEVDTEYGQSWDVKFHLTGDDGHKPSAWTDTEGMAEYLPVGFSLAGVDKLVRAIASGNPEWHEKARQWCEQTLHPRAYLAAHHALWADAKSEPISDTAIIRKQLIAAIQLHEYWTIDATPDDADATLETFAQFEARCGLTEKDRGFMPPGGWLFSVPLDPARVRRKQVPVLGPEQDTQAGLLADADEDEDYETPDEVSAEDLELAKEELHIAQVGLRIALEDVHEREKHVAEIEHHVSVIDDLEEEAQPEPAAAPVAASSEEDDLFQPAPKKRTPAPTAAAAAPPPPPSLPVLRLDMTEDDFKEMLSCLSYPLGEVTVQFVHDGETGVITKCMHSDIPAQYLASEAA